MAGAEIPGMIATLCSYESLFGPYHPQTLGLTTQVANAYWQAGEPAQARKLLERVVRDVGRCLGREHELRLRAVGTLRDVYLAQRDYERAGAMQGELIECHIQHLGSNHPETLAARTNLEMILLAKAGSGTNRTS